ncbi:hypothetical protein ABZ604_31510 [Streptomyces sp. NPDC012473]|uniref:hypothetical protein n=1 Tax=Streptomyces sp. NPDC012473 TaxID=3156676 RepID=UPI003411D57F
MAHPDTKYSEYGKPCVRTPRPWGYEYAAFKESHFGNDYETGFLTGWETDHMIARAVKRRCHVRIDVRGRISIIRRPRSQHLIVLDPVRVPASVTRRQFEDLELIEAAAGRARARVASDGGASIETGMLRIPPGAASVLRRRGWISEAPHTGRVALSAAGRMAMAWHWHESEGLNRRLLPGLFLDAALALPPAR